MMVLVHVCWLTHTPTNKQQRREILSVLYNYRGFKCLVGCKRCSERRMQRTPSGCEDIQTQVHATRNTWSVENEEKKSTLYICKTCRIWRLYIFAPFFDFSVATWKTKMNMQSPFFNTFCRRISSANCSLLASENRERERFEWEIMAHFSGPAAASMTLLCKKQ